MFESYSCSLKGFQEYKRIRARRGLVLGEGGLINCLHTEGKWEVVGGELAASCRQEMMVTSWEEVRDGDIVMQFQCYRATETLSSRQLPMVLS